MRRLTVVLTLLAALGPWQNCKKPPVGEPPATPDTPAGVSNGGYNTSYEYTSTSTDPEGDSIAIRFGWGDGETSDWSVWVAGGETAAMSHSWASPGTYLVKAQAKDRPETTSGWSEPLSVTITTDLPPSTPAKPTGPASAHVDSLSVFSVITTDPDGDGICYRLAWGDGDTSEWGPWVRSGDPVSVAHAWTSPGVFSIAAQAKDVHESRSAWSAAHVISTWGGWTRTFGGTESDDGYAVVQTEDGGFVVAGTTGSYGAGWYDIWLIRTDASGNKLWDKTFGGADADDGASVGQTTDGGYIITGSTSSYGAGESDVWLVRTDASGNKLWDRTFGGADADGGASVGQTTDGGYIITGSTSSYGAGNGDIWLIRTDASGNKLWDKTFGGTGMDRGNSVVQVADGGYVITGYTFSYGAGESDVWLIRTDASGNKLWDKTYGGARADFGSSAAQTADGGYVITGSTDSYGAGNGDIWLIRTDASGNKLWDKTLGGTSFDYGRSGVPTADGGFVIAGHTKSYGAGDSDIWLVRTDASGNKLWDKTYGGARADFGSTAAQTADGGYVITGSTDSYGAGSGDIWLARIDEQGNTQP